MHTAATDSLVGRSLEGRYRILERIARGGMSTVYAAVDERLDRLVAVKVMSSALSADPAFSDRFAREARAAARLTHLNAVSVYDQGFDNGVDSRSGQHVFLVMELVEGRTLRHLLRERGRLSVPEAMSVMEPVLSALSAAHRAGLVHRDVKPENILLSDDGVVKVADFGLARAVETDAAATRTGLMMGTVAYCPPEQIARGVADPRSDVYSAGIVLFELLTGEPPYRGDNAMNVAYQHVHSRVPAPSSRARGAAIPFEIDELVVNATDRDPSGRPGDAGAFLAEIADIRAALALPVTPVPPRPRTGPTGRRTPASRPADDRSDRTTAAFGPPTGRYDQRHDAAVDQRHVPSLAPPGRSSRAGRRARSTSGDPATADGPLLHPTSRYPGEEAGHWAGPATGQFHRAAPPPPVVIPPGVQPRRSPARRRRRPLIVLLVIVLLGAAAGFATWWFAAGRYSHVPAVGGDDLGTATSELRHAGYVVDVQLGPVFDDGVPAHRVLRTSPAAHTRAVRGQHVTVIVSAGPHYYPVGQVRNESVDAARATLESAGTVRVAPVPRHETSATVGKGLVIRTSPAAGAQVTDQQTITLYVSAGPPIVPVPTIAPGTDADDAAQTLQHARFRVTRNQDFSDTVPAGDVIRVSPDDRAPEFSTVRMDVSKGPRMVAVPDIPFGTDVATAEQTITDAGLVPELSQFSQLLGGSQSSDGQVYATVPNRNTLVPAGSKVTLYAVSN